MLNTSHASGVDMNLDVNTASIDVLMELTKPLRRGNHDMKLKDDETIHVKKITIHLLLNTFIESLKNFLQMTSLTLNIQSCASLAVPVL